MTSKWMWLSSAHSQLTLPTLPMVCPAETVSPFFTLASVVPQTRQILPEASSMATTGPHLSSVPVYTTVPAAGAVTSAPLLAA